MNLPKLWVPQRDVIDAIRPQMPEAPSGSPSMRCDFEAPAQSSEEPRSPLRTRSGCCLGCQLPGAAWAEKKRCVFCEASKTLALGAWFVCVFEGAELSQGEGLVGAASSRFLRLSGCYQPFKVKLYAPCAAFDMPAAGGGKSSPGISSRGAPLISTRQLRRGPWRCGKTSLLTPAQGSSKRSCSLIWTGRRPLRISHCSKLTSQVPGTGEWTLSQHILAQSRSCLGWPRLHWRYHATTVLATSVLLTEARPELTEGYRLLRQHARRKLAQDCEARQACPPASESD